MKMLVKSADSTNAFITKLSAWTYSMLNKKLTEIGYKEGFVKFARAEISQNHIPPFYLISACGAEDYD